MNIKKINELEFVEKAEGLYSVCSDANGNTKRYKISTSQGGGIAHLKRVMERIVLF